MPTKSQKPNGQDGALSSLNPAIDALYLAKSTASIIPAKAVFGSTNVLLGTILVGFFFPTLVECWLMQGKQGAISQHFHKKDNEAIASRKLDLDRIIHDFNVRSITSVWSPLTLLF